MPDERFLVTGAFGCIGAWTCRVLVREGVPVVAYDLGDEPARLRLILDEDELDRVTLVRGDVTDLAHLERTIDEHGTTHVVHLAALLLPQIKADPPRGTEVNVVGTVNVFEAARRRGLATVAYASSAAVYGPGRDNGLTASPTLAMLAAARGEPYRIAWGGTCQMQHAEDAARTFVAAARSGHRGAAVFNLGGPPSHMREIVAAIEAAAPEAAGSIAFDDVQLPFPPELDAGRLREVVGYAPETPLEHGVRETVELFAAAS